MHHRIFSFSESFPVKLRPVDYRRKQLLSFCLIPCLFIKCNMELHVQVIMPGIAGPIQGQGFTVYQIDCSDFEPHRFQFYHIRHIFH